MQRELADILSPIPREQISGDTTNAVINGIIHGHVVVSNKTVVVMAMEIRRRRAAEARRKIGRRRAGSRKRV